MRTSFHRRADLALRAWRAIGAGAQPLACIELHVGLGATLSFLPQVMAPLVRSRLGDLGPARAAGTG